MFGCISSQIPWILGFLGAISEPCFHLQQKCGLLRKRQGPFNFDFSSLWSVDYASYYQGLWDCHGDQSDELSFQRGDLIRILSKVRVRVWGLDQKLIFSLLMMSVRIIPCHILFMCVLHGPLTHRVNLHCFKIVKVYLKIQIQELISKFKKIQ